MKNTLNPRQTTNVPERTAEHTEAIKESIHDLRTHLNALEKALDLRNPRRALNFAWVEPIVKKALNIQYEAGRLNGAVLVHTTDTPHEP